MQWCGYVLPVSGWCTCKFLHVPAMLVPASGKFWGWREGGLFSNVNKVVSLSSPCYVLPIPHPLSKGGWDAFLQPSHQNSIQGLVDLCAGASLHAQESLLEGLLSVPQTSILQTDHVAVLSLVIWGRSVTASPEVLVLSVGWGGIVGSGVVSSSLLSKSELSCPGGTSLSVSGDDRKKS